MGYRVFTHNLKCCIIICLIVMILLYNYITYRPFAIYDNFDNNRNDDNIIGYIHVCQIGEWTKSYDLLMNSLKMYGLYDRTNEIRVGVVNETGELINDSRFQDSKIKIVYVGKNIEYERPTLLHMKSSCTTDTNGTLYYYLHTKGIQHFNTKNEPAVLKWINSMLYWNIQLWKNAVTKLQTYETYGCNYNNIHYSGNFWWATADHVKKLSDTIPEYYTAPEDWILTNNDNMYCVNNCGSDFLTPYPANFYK